MTIPPHARVERRLWWTVGRWHLTLEDNTYLCGRAQTGFEGEDAPFEDVDVAEVCRDCFARGNAKPASFWSAT